MAVRGGKWDAKAHSDARFANADDRMSFEIGVRWILLLSVTSWVVIAGFVF